MRFLFVNQHYRPDFAATAQQLADIAEELARRGHEVHVLTSTAIYDGRALDVPAEEVLEGVHIHRVPLSTARRDRLSHRFRGYGSFHRRALALAMTLPKPDYCVVLTTPPLLSMMGAYLRLRRGVPFAVWSMDVYPDIAVRSGLTRKMPGAAFTWDRLARWSCRRADRVVALGGDMRDSLAAKGIPAERIEIVPSWADGEAIKPIAHEENRFRARHVQPGKFCAIYSGNLGLCHLWREFSAAARALAGDDAIRFLFVGGGKLMPVLADSLNGCDVATFLPYQERDALAETLPAGDVHLLSLDPRFDGLLIPSKLYGILAAGRPAIHVGSEKSEVARVLREADAGIVVPPGEPAALVAALRWLAADPARTAAMGARGRAWFLEHADARRVVPRFAELLERRAAAR